MRRRTFLKGGASLAAMAAAGKAPALAQQAGNRVLRMIPHANLTSVDPIWTTAYISRNHAYMVWDTLYGTDERFQIRPQMAAGHEVSTDGKTYTIALRDASSSTTGSRCARATASPRSIAGRSATASGSSPRR
jgi:peptide/nickel transport system substrate-binding protein